MKYTMLAFIFAASNAFAAQAFWTGRMEFVTTVTGMAAWNCEYDYAGQTFWRVFQNTCPANVQVQ